MTQMQRLGRVLCNGTEIHKAKYYEWAKKYDNCPVVLIFHPDSPEKLVIVGISVAAILPGGWPGLKVYFGVAKGIYSTLPYPYWNAEVEEVRNKWLYYYKVWPNHCYCTISLLDSWPDITSFKPIAKKLLNQEQIAQPH